MSKAQAAATSNRKSSFSAAALVTTKDTLTFRLHPKQLAAFRSKATEILYRGPAGGGNPHLMRPPCAGCYPSTWLATLCGRLRCRKTDRTGPTNFAEAFLNAADWRADASSARAAAGDAGRRPCQPPIA